MFDCLILKFISRVGSTRRRINRTMGPRRNMNGAGAGGRLVARRGGEAGTTQLGNRDQRRYDLRVAFGVRGANGSNG